MEKRIIVISNINGMFAPMKELLRKVNYTHDDQLIFLGDYLDRGKEAKKVLTFLMELKKNNRNVVLLKGNEDELFLSFLTNNLNDDEIFYWLNSGGKETISNFVPAEAIQKLGYQWTREYITNTYSYVLEFLKQLDLFYENEEYIFVHAGLNPFTLNWKETTPTQMLWSNDVFTKLPLIYKEKKVVFANAPKREEYINGVWFSPCKRKIGLDGENNFHSQLNALIIREKDYQTTAVLTKPIYIYKRQKYYVSL